MRHWRQLLHGLLAVLLVFAFVSCGNDDDDNDDDNDTSTPTTTELPEPVIADIPPNVIQNAPEVLALQSYAVAMTAWANYVDTEGVSIDGGTQWTVTDTTTGDQVVMKAVETNNGVKWTVTVNGTLASEGEVNSDQTHMEWVFYDVAGPGGEATYTATANPGGGQTFELITAEVTYTGTINQDGSGSVKLVVGGQTTMETVWNADGSGTRKVYDAQGNVVIEQPF